MVLGWWIVSRFSNNWSQIEEYFVLHESIYEIWSVVFMNKAKPNTVLIEYCHTTVPSTPLDFCNVSLSDFCHFLFLFFIIIERLTLHIPGTLCTWTSYMPSSYLCLRIRFCTRFGAEFCVHLPLQWGRVHVQCFPEFLCDGGFSFLWEWEVLPWLTFLNILSSLVHFTEF